MKWTDCFAFFAILVMECRGSKGYLLQIQQEPWNLFIKQDAEKICWRWKWASHLSVSFPLSVRFCHLGITPWFLPQVFAINGTNVRTLLQQMNSHQRHSRQDRLLSIVMFPGLMVYLTLSWTLMKLKPWP